MRRLRSVVVIAVVAGAIGCVAARPRPRIAPGRPDFVPGAPEAYWVWHDEGGWHLRATTASLPHRFHGAILPVAGAITDVRPIRVESRDRIRMSAGGISFDFVTQGGEDGFDWHVSSGCNRFEIYVDGAPRPGLVNLGGHSQRPRRVPFERCR